MGQMCCIFNRDERKSFVPVVHPPSTRPTEDGASVARPNILIPRYIDNREDNNMSSRPRKLRKPRKQQPIPQLPVPPMPQIMPHTPSAPVFTPAQTVLTSEGEIERLTKAAEHSLPNILTVPPSGPHFRKPSVRRTPIPTHGLDGSTGSKDPELLAPTPRRPISLNLPLGAEASGVDHLEARAADPSAAARKEPAEDEEATPRSPSVYHQALSSPSSASPVSNASRPQSRGDHELLDAVMEAASRHSQHPYGYSTSPRASYQRSQGSDDTVVRRRLRPEPCSPALAAVGVARLDKGKGSARTDEGEPAGSKTPTFQPMPATRQGPEPRSVDASETRVLGTRGGRSSQ